MNLAFVPARLVPSYRANGFELVKGCETPAGWAVLMRETGVATDTPAPEPQKYQSYRSNKSRGASMANFRRYNAARA